MNDEFKEEFINTSQSKEEFGWSLIEGILEMYLFRVYDFFFKLLLVRILSFFPSFSLPVRRSNKHHVVL